MYAILGTKGILPSNFYPTGKDNQYESAENTF